MSDNDRRSPEAVVERKTRSKRKRLVRARTIPVHRLSKQAREIQRRLHPEAGHRQLPLTRGDCIDGERPCPYVSCRFHLYLDVNPRTGAIKLNFPDLDVHELGVSCALDVADAGALDKERIGALMNITRERVRQIEEQAVGQLSRGAVGVKLREWADEGPVGKRRLPVLENT